MTKHYYNDAVDMLSKLITIPSFSGEEEKASNYLQTVLEESFPNCVKRNGHNLIVDIHGKAAGETLLLCSHIDTVQVTNGWNYNPFGAHIDGDKLYGLGSNDAGASLVSIIAAVRSLIPLKFGRILLCLVAEEEAGSGGFATIEPTLPRYDAAIFGEPTNLCMAPSMRGAMGLVMVSRGESCHASMPWEGKNAIDKIVQDVAALRTIDLKDGSPWGSATIEPTLVKGGKSNNQIPASVETFLDIRTTGEKHNAWVLDQLKKAEIEIEVQFDHRKPMFNPPDSKIVAAFTKHYSDKPICVFNGTCDMAFSTAPSIILGPGDLKIAHVADEHTSLSAIKEAIGVYASIISTFLENK